MLTGNGACASCPRPGFLGFALKSALSCTWNLPMAVEVTCTGFKCSRWTKEFEDHKAFWLKRESVTPCLGSTHLLQTLGCESQQGAYSLMTLSRGRETNVIAFQPLPFRPGSLLLLLGSHARPLGLFPEKGPSLLPAHCPAM